MNPQKPIKSLQDVLKQRQQFGFVGREEQMSLFRRNLELPIEDYRRHFLFNVWGQGGVGKSSLLRQFRQIAEEAKAITAYTDESERSIPGVMTRLAQQLEQQGYKLAQFSDRYQVYRQKQQELEADPEAPQGFSAFVGRTVAKTGVGLARQVPGASVALELIDVDTLATQAGEWTSYVAKKFTDKDEVRLVQEPVEVLTPLFLKDICKVARKIDLALFFDTYERTEEFIDGWLCDILEGRYGEVPLNILIVIAGRQELDKNRWAAYEGLIVRLPLEPFTEQEAQSYLVRKGITNRQVIELILQLSERLPLLVATLAAENPHEPSQVDDPSGTAVERFLKWVDEPKRRQVALDAAIPRYLNRDVLAKLWEEEEADALFNWLKEMPFIEEHIEGWAYHALVRTQMLRHKRLVSPKSWGDLHGKLADYYDTLRHNLQLDEEQGWRDEFWQCYKLNVLYHRLCQSWQKSLPLALNEFLDCLKHQLMLAQGWAETMVQAGKDADVADVQSWGEQLVKGLKAYDEKRYEIAASMLSELLNYESLEAKQRLVTLIWRGGTYLLMERYEDALDDYNQAIELDPHSIWAIAYRGLTYRSLKRYQEALQDFDQAIALDPNYVWAIARRGRTYCEMERYEEALRDYDRAIALNPNSAWLFIRRGQVYQFLKRYEEAIQDFNRAKERDADLFWAMNDDLSEPSSLTMPESIIPDFLQ
ncbi:tetratricopeptide repeat protein [Coleofasciculus chthonoplastes]|uniref:tetratricopeptide repeat protein n=1 Tax=Coleofasciculus chthonoplastes TaxID=64178 RepID=UPI003300BCF9